MGALRTSMGLTALHWIAEVRRSPSPTWATPWSGVTHGDA